MKNFIAKNPVLFIVIALSVAVGIYFLIGIVNGHAAINKSIETIDANTAKIAQINQARDPNFVKESEQRILKDTEQMKECNEALLRRFGKPYRVALEHFLSTLHQRADKTQNAENAQSSAPADNEFADLTEDSLRKILAELWKKAVEDGRETGVYDRIPNRRDIEEGRSALFGELREKVVSQGAPDRLEARGRRFDLAFDLFMQEIQKDTLEKIDLIAAQQIFLEALGLPRQKEPRKCRAFVEVMCKNYSDSDLIPGFQEKKTSSAETAQTRNQQQKPGSASASIYDFLCSREVMTESKPPNPGRVISIMRNFQILEDLFRRMNAAGIKDLVAISADQNYTSSGPFLSYGYTITLRSNLNEIAAFVNSLHNAFDTNRVYVIRKMSLIGSPEEVPSADRTVSAHRAAAEAEQAAKEKAKESSSETPGAASASAKNASGKDETKAFTEVFPLSNPKHPEYGMVLLGGRRDVTCVIEVQYQLYQADNLFEQ